MNEWLSEIAKTVDRIYRDAVDPVSEQFSYRKTASTGEISGPPLVLFLGNHSSGKSTFINYLLGEDAQKTGLAPTDDSFTLLTWGDEVDTIDGPSVVSNPDLPYVELKHFGTDLVTHLRMKRRPVEMLKHLTLVDSPGMIDQIEKASGRGFDFPGVVKWFAERADVVLVFFDPDKPGTTGETLEVFTESLGGIDHKLLIVMNKMDRFRSLGDFARAYGALCWNLGKVIHRKDLPIIFTTYVPVPGAPAPVLPLEDFDKAREELIDEVTRAPARRVDNMLTQCQTFTEQLRLHSRLIDEASRDFKRTRRRMYSTLLGIVALNLVIAAASLVAGSSLWVPILFAVLGVLLGLGGARVVKALSDHEEERVVGNLYDIHQRLYAREMLIRDRHEDLEALWEGVHKRTKNTIKKLGLAAFPRLSRKDLRRLDTVLDEDIPQLRSDLHGYMNVDPDEAEPEGEEYEDGEDEGDEGDEAA